MKRCTSRPPTRREYAPAIRGAAAHERTRESKAPLSVARPQVEVVRPVSPASTLTCRPATRVLPLRFHARPPFHGSLLPQPDLPVGAHQQYARFTFDPQDKFMPLKDVGAKWPNELASRQSRVTVNRGNSFLPPPPCAPYFMPLPHQAGANRSRVPNALYGQRIAPVNGRRLDAATSRDATQISTLWASDPHLAAHSQRSPATRPRSNHSPGWGKRGDGFVRSSSAIFSRPGKQHPSNLHAGGARKPPFRPG